MDMEQHDSEQPNTEQPDREQEWLDGRAAKGDSARAIAAKLRRPASTVTRGRDGDGKVVTRALREAIAEYLDKLAPGQDEDAAGEGDSRGDAGDVADAVAGDVSDASESDASGDDVSGRTDDVNAVAGEVPASRAQRGGKEGEPSTEGTEDAGDSENDSPSASESPAGRDSDAPSGEADDTPDDAEGNHQEQSGGRRRRRRRRRTRPQARRQAELQEIAERKADEAPERRVALLELLLSATTLREIRAVSARIRSLQLYLNERPLPYPAWHKGNQWALSVEEARNEALAQLLGASVAPWLPEAWLRKLLEVRRVGWFDLLSMPEGIQGDARELIVTREPVIYADEGALLLAFSPGQKRFECGWTAAELREGGVLAGDRMLRYVCAGHDDRPERIGYRRANVIPARPYPDEDWFFGSEGFVDERGVWQPGRAELVALWRHVEAMHLSWGAAERQSVWHIELYRERAELEIRLMSERYGMTFDQRILGRARWPVSTRSGNQTQRRLIQLAANEELKARYQAQRRRSARMRGLMFGWTVSLLGRVVYALRRDLAEYERRPSGNRLRWWLREPLRNLRVLRRIGLRPSRIRSRRRARRRWRSSGFVARRKMRDRLMPAFFDDVERQRWLTRAFSWLLYRRHSALDGSVSGSADWVALDPPLTDRFATPHPRTGYVPSGAYLRRFRAHTFEPGYVAPVPVEEEVVVRRMPALRPAMALTPVTFVAGALVSGLRWMVTRRSVRREQEVVLIRQTDQVIVTQSTDD